MSFRICFGSVVWKSPFAVTRRCLVIQSPFVVLVGVIGAQSRGWFMLLDGHQSWSYRHFPFGLDCSSMLWKLRTELYVNKSFWIRSWNYERRTRKGRQTIVGWDLNTVAVFCSSGSHYSFCTTGLNCVLNLQNWDFFSSILFFFFIFCVPLLFLLSLLVLLLSCSSSSSSSSSCFCSSSTTYLCGNNVNFPSLRAVLWHI